jgi:predicted SAM-dependent methyltransferase
MIDTFRNTRNSKLRQLIEILLALRALFFVGTRYTCPCCGWRLRAFTYGGTSFRVRPLSYCPRCNSKARHRRNWLYLQQNTNLFSDHLRVLDVSPKYSFSRRFIKMPNLDYVGIDLYDCPNICLKTDLTATSFSSDTFDAIICIHVLEHIEQDRQAIQELFRVLKPEGWAIISVPIRLDQKTFEDPTITEPEERERAFGERQHFRIYGYDLIERLKECGFQVQLNLGKDVDQQTKDRYGLRDDENIFYCTKAIIR